MSPSHVRAARVPRPFPLHSLYLYGCTTACKYKFYFTTNIIFSLQHTIKIVTHTSIFALQQTIYAHNPSFLPHLLEPILNGRLVGCYFVLIPLFDAKHWHLLSVDLKNGLQRHYSSIEAEIFTNSAIKVVSGFSNIFYNLCTSFFGFYFFAMISITCQDLICLFTLNRGSGSKISYKKTTMICTNKV